jgi:AraC-like DNA-binding protein/mannose-6-phosphate isomerase-like protein (cupin superfamily)
MNDELIEVLRRISPEEQQILDGKNSVNKEIYTSGKDFIIDSRKMLETGKLIAVRPHTRFIAFPKHRHNYIEIIYMCQGVTVHTVNGGERVELSSGELLFLNQHAFHEIEPAGEEDIAVNFIVLPEFFDIVMDLIGQDNILSSFILSALMKDSDEVSYLHFKVSDVLPVQNLVENLVWNIVNRQPNSRNINQHTMGLLLLCLLNHTDRIVREQPKQYDNLLIISLLKEIEENYKSISLTEFAGRNHQPVRYISRIVKQYTGSTYKELLQQKRMKKAVQLLNTTRLPVGDIITAVGYDNTSFFYRCFRQTYGISPGEYRQMNR